VGCQQLRCLTGSGCGRQRSQSPRPAAWQTVAWSALALAGGLILLLAGVLLYTAGGAAPDGGIGPFGRG